MPRHSDGNGAPTHIRFLLKPVGCEVERRAIENPPSNWAVECVDDGRDERLGKIEDAPFWISGKGRLNVRPSCMQVLIELRPVRRVVKVESESLNKEGY